MRAAVYHGPGDVRIEDRPEPGPPAADELVLDVLRASLCGTDAAEYDHGPVLVSLHQRHPHSGHVGPLVLGHEFVGRVVVAGAATGFAAGERMVSGAGVSCGSCPRCQEGRTNLCERYHTVGLHLDGGLAQQVLVPASTCVRVPDACSDDSAALAQPMAVAIHALNRGGARPGRSLLVNGAGGIGAFAVAAAAHRGIERIVACDIDPERLRAASRLGATHVVDAREADLPAQVRAATGTGADVVVEASGAPSGPADCVAAAAPGATVVIVGLQREPRALDLLDLALREIDVCGSLAHVCATDLPEALEVLADGSVVAQMVERTIALEHVVDQGLEPLRARSVSGKVLVDPRA